MEEEAKKKAEEELSRKLENILQPIKQKTESRNQGREGSIEVESPEDIAEEEKAYDELVKELKSPEFTSQLAQESQQAVKDFLNQEGQATAQAQDLAESLASQVRQLLSLKQKLDTTASLTHVGDALKEIHQELIHVEHQIKATQESLTALCKKYNLPEPDLTPEPPISKEMLKSIFSKVLDTTVPGSELIKILSGLSNTPQNQQEWLQLALDTALGLMPGGKIFKFLKGGVGKLGIKQIESQILKVAARKAKKLKLNINSSIAKQLLDNLNITVGSFISKFRKSSIKEVLPSEFLNMTIEEALKSGNTTIRKLLTQERFIK